MRDCAVSTEKKNKMAEPFSTMQSSRRKRTSTRDSDGLFSLLEVSDDENGSLAIGSDI